MFEKQNNFIGSLLQMGFSENEASVYLALLQLGKGTASEIAGNAGVGRTTVYDILFQLSKKGLVSISGKEPKQEYQAENPENLIKYLKKESERKEQNVRYAEIMLPEFKSIHKVGERPRVKFFEGTAGLENVYEDTLTATEPIRAYANVDDMHNALPHYFPKYYKRRAGKGIAIRAIIPKNEAGKERGKLDRLEKRETAFVSPEKFNFVPEINVYDNKVMIASWREKLGIIIESEEIADAMKKIFELAWVEAKRLDKEGRK